MIIDENFPILSLIYEKISSGISLVINSPFCLSSCSLRSFSFDALSSSILWASKISLIETFSNVILLSRSESYKSIKWMNNSSNGQMTYQMDEWFIKWTNDLSNGWMIYQMDKWFIKWMNDSSNGQMIY